MIIAMKKCDDDDDDDHDDEHNEGNDDGNDSNNGYRVKVWAHQWE